MPGFNAVHGRIGNRTLLTLSYGLTAVGDAAFALMTGWPLMLAAALLTGLGFGGIDYGLNQLFAVGFGDCGSAMLNVLNARFGIGAVAGPTLPAVLGTDRYAYAFGGFAVLAAVPALCTICPPPVSPPRRGRPGRRTPVSPIAGVTRRRGPRWARR